MESLSYAEPIEMASASGVWMTDTSGRRYLDMYNNVVCLGHSHPRVTSAVARQWRVLNTNLRYLHHSAVELGERLLATCPPGLDTVLFVNSGSEANDVAWRIARHHTGNDGGLCTAYAYHGITEAIAALSPETLPPDGLAAHVETWAPADAYRGSTWTRGNSSPRWIDCRSKESRPRRPSWTACCRATACSIWSRRTCRSWSGSPTPPVACGSPTRCRAATDAPARRCGRSSGSASRRTS